MSERIQGLAPLLPDKNSLDDYTLEELQQAAKRYPYFAPVQFLLLQKMKDMESPEAAAQLQKATLYFHDPLLFDYFVSAKRLASNGAFEEQSGETVTAKPPAVEEPLFLQKAEDKNAVESAPDSDGSASLSKAFSPLESTAPALSEQQILTNVLPETDIVTDPEAVELKEPFVLSAAPLPEAPAMIPEPETGKGSATLEEPQLLPSLSVNEADTLSLVPTGEPENIVATNSDSLPFDATTEPAPAVDNKDSQTSKEPLLFEPFHTVDYFASQGIRMTADELPKDKLSKQLRSFTDWLRIMKRLPVAEVAQSPETVAEKSVESLASHSVKGSEVVTEAMAEVWARQGNRQKAIETYNKLSLLNPSKRTYFAAKIENLS